MVDKESSAWIYCTDHLLEFRHKAEARLTQRHFAAAVTALRIGIYSKGFATLPQAFGQFRRNQVCCWTTVAMDSVVLCYRPFQLFDACFTT
ncbi:hypothetical protein MRX96_041978 [Rhipicephalus microplus]